MPQDCAIPQTIDNLLFYILQTISSDSSTFLAFVSVKTYKIHENMACLNTTCTISVKSGIIRCAFLFCTELV